MDDLASRKILSESNHTVDLAGQARRRTLQAADRFDPPAIPDLRRRVHAETAARICELAEHLPMGDREVLRAVFADARRVAEVAALLGRTPRQIRGRVRALTRRVLDPRFEFVVRSRDRWPDERRLVAQLRLIEGRPMRSVARLLGMTLHHVRRQEDTIDALFEAAGEVVRDIDRACA
ncbi:MAG: hypothetical protein AAFR38_00315 [Planctomycetota bacterium]